MRPELLRLGLWGALLTGACGGADAAGPGDGGARAEREASAAQPIPAEDDDPPRTDTQQELDGRTFLLRSAQGFEPVPGTQIHIAFDGSQLNANADCNALNGSFRLEAGRLVLERWSTTNIGCFGARGAQDNWYHSFLSSQPELELGGNDLVLRGASATLHYLDREVADPDRALVDTLWTVTSFIEAGGTSAGGGPVQIEQATLRLAADGGVEVHTDCNQGQGRYSVAGARIVLSELAYTEEGCALPLIEAKVQAVLSDGELTFAIEARQLTLTRGTIGLHLEAP